MSQATQSAVRTRTRLTIVEAAIRVLVRNPTATMAEVASEAGVGRTTVHRYFDDRGELLRGVVETILDRTDDVVAQADLDRGDAAEAILRLCQHYFDLGDWLTVLFTTASQVLDDADWERQSDRQVTETIVRGQDEGSIDRQLPASWLLTTMWGTLYSAWELARTSSVTRYEALGLCLASMRKILAPVP